MSTYISADTIAAIATAPGAGGIAILRTSGPDALRVLHRLFSPVINGWSGGPGQAGPEARNALQYGRMASEDSTSSGFHFKPRYMHYGHALDSSGHVLDHVLAVYMPAPHSATGEDVGEIHCHGGTGIAALLLEACLKAGARSASSGEFTRRAFMHGKLDLTQAEAVAELVSAPGREGIRLARAKLEGHLSQRIMALRRALDQLRIQVTLAVDFPEEEAELLSREAFQSTLERAREEIRGLLAGYARARLWREGVSVVLAGRVNAGKSSLLNAFLGRKRAIVSDAPGTTRDYIEEMVSLAGMPVRLFDTAGLRESGDVVEAEGIGFSRGLAEEADCLLLVVDNGMGIGHEDWEFLYSHEKLVRSGRVLLVMNKMDNPVQDGERTLSAASGIVESALPLLSGAAPSPVHAELLSLCRSFPVSAKLGSGLDELAEGICAAVTASAAAVPGVEGDTAPNIRQALLLESALAELEALAEDLALDMPADILGVRLDVSVSFLDEVTGASSTEELLDQIFATFCIGK